MRWVLRFLGAEWSNVGKAWKAWTVTVHFLIFAPVVLLIGFWWFGSLLHVWSGENRWQHGDPAWINGPCLIFITLLHWISAKVLRPRLYCLDSGQMVRINWIAWTVWVVGFGFGVYLVIFLVALHQAGQFPDGLGYAMVLLLEVFFCSVSHIATAGLLAIECEQLRSGLDSRQSSDVLINCQVDEVQSVKRRWKAFLVLHVLLEGFMLLHAVISALLRVDYDDVAENPLVEWSFFVFLLAGFIVQLIPVASYNGAVDEAKRFAEDFPTLRRLQVKPVEFTIFSVVVSPARMRATAVSLFFTFIGVFFRQFFL